MMSVLLLCSVIVCLNCSGYQNTNSFKTFELTPFMSFTYYSLFVFFMKLNLQVNFHC